MLFNANRNIKDNLFQMYKKDALEHERRKNETKQKQLIEEKAYLDSLKIREDEHYERQKMERMQRINNEKLDYKQSVQKIDTLRKNKFEHVNINTYGVRKHIPNHRGNTMDQPSNVEPFQQPNRASSPLRHEVSNNFTDYGNNGGSVRVEQQKMYKDYLGTQVSYILFNYLLLFRLRVNPSRIERCIQSETIRINNTVNMILGKVF